MCYVYIHYGVMINLADFKVINAWASEVTSDCNDLVGE